MNPISLVAHRGYQKRYPENTLLSLAEAIQAGARYVETDIQLSADLVPVLYHDRNMKKISGEKGAIHERPFAELINIPAHEPNRFGDRFISQRITPLADLVTLLAAHPQVHAFIEIKRCTIDAHGIAKVYQRVTEALMPVLNQCTLISFSQDFIAYANDAAWPSIGLVIERWKVLESDYIKQLKPQYIFCNQTRLPSSANLAIAGSQLVVYEIDNPKIAIELNKRGVDLIETFAFAEMQNALDKTFQESVGAFL